MKSIKKFWHNHSLSLVLLIILLVQTIVYVPTSYLMWKGEQKAHGEDIRMLDYWNFFATEMNVSMLADTYGAILLVLLTKRLKERGSEESKDTNDEK